MKNQYQHQHEIHGDDCAGLGWIILEILALLAILGAIIFLNWPLDTKTVKPAPVPAVTCESEMMRGC